MDVKELTVILIKSFYVNTPLLSLTSKKRKNRNSIVLRCKETFIIFYNSYVLFYLAIYTSLSF